MKLNRFSLNPGFIIGLALTFSSFLTHADDALSFNGTIGQSVSIPHEPAQNAYPLTVMCWFQEPSGSSGGGALVNKYVSSSLNGWMIAIGGQLHAWYYRDGADSVGNTGAGGVNDGLWHHGAFVVDAGGGHLYLDGVLKQTVAWSGTPGPSTTVTPINLGLYPGDSYFSGQLDEVSIWNVALTQTQIQAYMHQTLQGTEPGLVSYYRMNEGTGTNIYDYTTNADTGVFSPNPPTWILSGAPVNPIYQLGTRNLACGPGTGTNSVVLKVPSGTNWTATANTSWLHVLTASGTGNANVIFSFDTNSGSTRTGTLTIGGQILTVTQAGATYVSAGALTTLASGLNAPGSVAVDASGNIFIANTGASTILKWTRANNAVSTVVPLSANLDAPEGVAVDGVGNLLIADTGNHAVKKWTATNGVVSTLLGSGVANPWSIAADDSGNAYFVDDLQAPVFEWIAASNSVVTLFSSGANSPEGIAVDAARNLYISDTGHNFIKEWVAANSTLVTLSSASAQVSVPTSLAVDGSGNLYLPNFSANSIIKWSAATGNQTTLTTSSSVNRPFGVAVDVAGNLYIADTSANVVRELPFAFVDPTPISKSVTAGSDFLPAVVPATVNLSAPFAPTSDQSWLTITGTAGGVVSYSFTANSGAPRTAHIGLLGQIISVNQGGGSYTLGATNLLVGPLAGTNSDLLLVSGASTWTVSANVPWLHAQAGYVSGAGSTNLLFISDANQGITRTGILTVANQTLTVTQAGSNYVAVTGGTPAILTTNGLVGAWDTALDAAGNVYIADYNGNAVREWVKTNNTVITLVSGLSSPQSIAVDSLGNVYISDSYANSILKWTAANSNVTTLVSSGLISPYGIAVDTSGNVYIADSIDDQIKEWIATNGTVITLVSGLAYPTGVAVDLLGDVYFSELDSSTLKEWSPVTATVKTLATQADGLIYPFNLAVDGSGNVYIGDPNDGTIQEWTAAYGTVSVAASGFESWGAGVDASGNIFVADSTGALSELQRAFINASPKAEPIAAGTDTLPVVVPVNAFQMPQFFPTSDQPWVTITSVTNGVISFSFTANNTAAPRSANINVLGLNVPVNQGYVLLGATNLLEGAGTGADSVILAVSPQYLPWTASANSGWLHLDPAYQSGTMSTNVVFTFDANPGATRTGTLTLGNQTLVITQVGSTYVSAPASMTALVPYGLVAPANSAVDGAGNLYIAAAGNPAISEWTPSNNSVTTLASAGLDHPTGIVLDGQGYGYVFVADLLSNAVYAVIPPSTNLYPLVTTGLSFPFSLAVDSSVNVYIADSGNNAIKKFNLGDGTVTPVVVTGLSLPEGVAVDLAGNVYIADTGNNAVKEWIAASSNVVTLVSTGLNAPSGLAVDGSGNVYIADSGNSAIKKWTAATRNVVTLQSSGLNQPSGVTVDNAGNVYISDYGNNAVEELPRAFVDPTPRVENFAAGSDVLPVVLPASSNLLPPFAPTSDQPWLTIDSANNGMVGFSFTNNFGPVRAANIDVLGQLISVTQSNLIVTSPLLANPKILSNGAFQFNFTNTPGAPFTVLSTTNLALPASNWTILGAPSNLAPGQFQFTTDPLTNDPQRFYRVSSP